MHTLPVDAKILEDALHQLAPQPEGCYDWAVCSSQIGCGGNTMWDSEEGEYVPREGYDDAAGTMMHLLKSRRSKHLYGWEDLTCEGRTTFRQAQTKKTGLNDTDIWPFNSRTGAEYVEACAWYDRVEAELGEGEAVSKTPADVQHQRPYVLWNALEFGMLGGWCVSDDYITRHQMIFWDRENGACGDEDYADSCRLVRLLTQERQRGSGRLTGLTLEMHKDADQFAGRGANGGPWPWKAVTGEAYLRACASYDHIMAQKTDHDSPNDELAEVKEAWEGLIPKRADAATPSGNISQAMAEDFERVAKERVRKAAKSLVEDIPHATEQPWEKQARVAASAGYVHVSSADTKPVPGGLREFAEKWGPKRYAQIQPDAPLSGMRSINGWAVSGFAVTNPHACPEAGQGRGPITKSDMQMHQMYAARKNLGMPREGLPSGDLRGGRTQSKSPNFTEL